jgi:hypothetical protein
MANDHLLLKQVLSSRGPCEMHCSPLYFQGLTELRSNTQPSIVRPLRPTRPFRLGEQESEPNFCIGWERHCSWSLRLSQIFESLEISRSSVRHPFRFGAEWSSCGAVGISTTQDTESASFDQWIISELP